MALPLPQLLEQKDYEANFQGQGIAETWQVNWNDVYPFYNLNYPILGQPHRTLTHLQCVAIKINPEAKIIDGQWTAILEATFNLDYRSMEGVFSIRAESGGHRTFKMQAGGLWADVGLKGTVEQGELEYKLPITNISASTRVIGEIDYTFYENKVGKLNDLPFWGRFRGTVLFDSYSITPKFMNKVVVETSLDLKFQICSIDWNYEYRNPMQFINPVDNKPAFWQNKYEQRFDYTNDNTKVGLPIWSGEITGYGNPQMGVGSWSYRTFDMPNYNFITGAWEMVPRCVYEYTDFSDLIAGPVPPEP